MLQKINSYAIEMLKTNNNLNKNMMRQIQNFMKGHIFKMSY